MAAIRARELSDSRRMISKPARSTSDNCRIIAEPDLAIVHRWYDDVKVPIAHEPTVVGSIAAGADGFPTTVGT